MGTYNTVIKKRNAANTGWDSILPITTAENVLINEQGDTVATHMADYTLIKPKVNYMRPEDIGHILALIEKDSGLKFAILGDSVEAGRKPTARDADYGEIGDKRYPTGLEEFCMSLVFSSPYFLPFDPNVAPIFKPYIKPSYGGKNLPWNRIYLAKVAGVQDHAAYTYTYKHISTNLKQKRNTLTVIYLKRTNDRAAKFDVISNGVTTTIDTYEPPRDFGAITAQPLDGWDIAFKEIAINTDSELFSFTLDNVDMSARPTTTGEAIIIGFYYGKSVEFRNFAVGGSTLKNISDGNTDRGITTDDRFTAAFSYGANVFIIGWGTNDSKLYPSYSPDDYKADLEARIEQIREEVDNPTIILCSHLYGIDDGGSGALYINSPLYYAKMKELAVEKGCSFYDYSAVLEQFDRGDVLDDHIHPGAFGYKVMANDLSNIFRIDVTSKNIQSYDNQNDIRSNFLRFVEYSIIDKLANIVSNKDNLLRVAFFDTAGGTVLIDRAGKENGVLSSQQLAFEYLGTLRVIKFGSSDSWEFPDANDLSFGDGAGNDVAFSVIWFGKPDEFAGNVGSLVSKRIITAGSAHAEWHMTLNGTTTKSIRFNLFKSDASAYIGRVTDALSPSYNSKYITAIGTYGGAKTNGSVKIYVDGVQADTANYSSGSYTGMTPGNSIVGNYRANGSAKDTIAPCKVGFVAIIKEELTTSQVKAIDRLLRSAYNFDNAVTL